MNDNISVFKGAINEYPVGSAHWNDVLERIKSGKYKSFIEQARSITDSDQYREYKKKLPAVTFGGEFAPKRNRENVTSATGFIIADLDHIDDEVDYFFNLLKMDENIWFAFKSPSGKGIKCGLRASGIKTDSDNKRFYAAVEWYFLETYQLSTDPSCKDISRLTFVSHDPELYINEKPSYFDIVGWTPPETRISSRTCLPSRNGSSKEAYARKVLESCCEEIRLSLPGQQHNTRLRKANLIGGFCQYIDENEIIGALEQAVTDSGAKNVQAAMKTVRDGIERGKLSPIEIPDHKKLTELTELTPLTQTNGNSHPTNAQLTETNAQLTPLTQKSRQFQGNLTGAIREYCKENQGVITAAQIDREFGLQTPKEKNLRRQALLTLSREKIIIKDNTVPGRYCILNSQIEWISLLQTDLNYFDICLPVGLGNLVMLPPKSIVVIAGTSNSGKTAVALEILKRNMKKKYTKLYLMSEMGPTEYCQRVGKVMAGDIGTWESNIKAASVTSGFFNPIIMHNPDGLTVVDYLEEVDGEYYKITSSLRQIYDALNNGLAVVNLQKHSKADVGRGGEGTTEKARLYLTIDTLAHQPRCTVSAIKIIKAKDYPGENPNGKEVHVKISAGCEMEPISEWMYCNKTQREKYIKKYQGQLERSKELSAEIHPDDVCAKMLCDDGDYRYLLLRDFEKWQKQFPKLDLDKEIAGIEKWAEKNPGALKSKNWFFQVGTMLYNKSEGKKK